MAGTHIGGIRSGIINKFRYGDDYYKVIGREGGKKGKGGRFVKDHEFARQMAYKSWINRKGLNGSTA